jgi:hypothetical protein
MRERAWPKKWSALADACGGIDALAAKLLTTRRVVERWAYGRVPGGPTVAALRMLSAAVGVASPV